MIRKLQVKFVAMCMVMVTAVLAVVFFSAYASAQQNIQIISREVLQRVLRESASNALSRPDIGLDLGDRVVQLPYFTVEVWQQISGTYSAYVTGGTYANLEDTEELTAIITDCLSQDRTEGTVDSYNLRYLRQDNGLYQKLAFVDMSMEQATLREMMGSYFQIGAASLLLLLGVSILLARWATRPVERAWRQQRQFLSDASHELKTPLTVILSNAEMLQSADLPDRPARWSDNIRSEAGRMKSLVEEMLTLARADNAVRTAVMETVSLTDVAADCALSFEPVAFEAGKPLREDLAGDVTVLGDREKLRQVIAILLDNAVKYGAAGGAVLDGIVQQNGDHLPQLLPVSQHRHVPGQVLPQGLARLKGHRLEGQCAVRRHVGEGHRLHHRRADGVVRTGQCQHLLHQGFHAPGLGADVVAPPGGPVGQVRRLEHLRVGEDHRQRRFQLMGGVGEELALLAPGPLHRPGGPAGQEDGHAQKQQQRRRADLKIGAHHLPQGGLLHGHVHKGQLLIQSVVLAEITQVVAVDGALRPVLGEAVGDDGGQLLRVLQIGVGTAGDIGAVRAADLLPHLHGEVGQLDHPVPQVQPDVRPGQGVGGALPQHPLEHLPADDLDVLLGGGVGGEEHHRQHRRHHDHAHGHKFYLQFTDHGQNTPFLSKKMWKSGNQTGRVRFPAPPGSSPPCGWCGSLRRSADAPACAAERRCRPPRCCPRRRTRSPRSSAAASPW